MMIPAVPPYEAPVLKGPQFREHVQIDRQVVRLKDVADLSSLPHAVQVAAKDLPVAKIGDGQNLTITSTEISLRIRRQAPALGPWLARAKPTAVVVQYASASASRPRRDSKTSECVLLLHSIPAGGLVGLADVKSSPCKTTAQDFSYDLTNGLARARRNLEAGEVCGPLTLAALAAVKPGQEVTLKSQVGSVSVQRLAKVILPARSSGKALVQTASGTLVQVDVGELDQ